ncbi:ANTAR domain-containing protein [Pseudofrankia saprophytica]|uniref:ANTAR domain-containing protein n=1 Tax=Pseudofrankia saprophytica TaxID=298655 RepID=UPI0012FF0AE8|nr:ANTAR domain-containing protein [Pseudofrankia saprophytica]
MLEDDAEREDIRASLRMSLPPSTPAAEDPAATTSLILFAAAPGAFLDLATDLSWLTNDSGGLGTTGFVLDEDLTVPRDPAAPSGLKTQSTIDQAVGVLIGRGNTPEQAYQHLDMLAADARVGRPTAAEAILAELDGPSWTDLGADDGRPAHPQGPDGEAIPTLPPRDP